MSAPFRLLDECVSTNDEARRWAAEGAPHGAWVLAKRQTQGRGRQGREWLGAEGNLFLSVVLRLEAFPYLTWTPLATAISAVQALQFEVPELPLQLKWPNDIWLGEDSKGGGKAGGVLCEAGGGVVIAGVGLNLSQRPTGQLLYPARAIAEFSRHSFHPEVLAARTAWNLIQTLGHAQAHGLANLRAFYDAHALFTPGTFVSWGEHTGQVLGLGPAGELRVQVGEQEQGLYAEDVSVRKV
jgi:BirA family biotin operon repressor/biotin-[acetyl-CoA-carboxylase] ligase